MNDNKIKALVRRIDLLEALVLQLSTDRFQNSQESNFEVVVESIIMNNKNVDIESKEGKILLKKYSLRITHWDHRWGENLNIGYCHFNGTALIVDENTGIIPTWNLIETNSTDSCDIAEDNNEYYKPFQNADRGSFGWGQRDGERKWVCARLKFYGNDGVFTYKVRSLETCGPWKKS